MKFALLCVAATLAVAAVGARVRWMDDPNNDFGDDVKVEDKYWPTPSTNPPPTTEPPPPPTTPPPTTTPAPTTTIPPPPPPTTTKPPPPSTTNYPTPNYWPPPSNWPPPNYYPTPSPTTTTTADPMCPRGKSAPCRELPASQRGSIQVRNNGLVTLQFFLEYNLRGRKVKEESRAFGFTYKKTLEIPADAEDIVLTVQGIGLFGATSDILKKQWKYPVIRCYASADGQNVNQVGC